MKVTLVSRFKENDLNTPELMQEFSNKNIELEQVELNNINQYIELEKLGDGILWRSASFSDLVLRTAFLKLVKGKKTIVNRGIMFHPTITHKIYQEKFLNQHSDIPTIKSFICTSIEDFKKYLEKEDLKFPVLVKPNTGARGSGISILKTVDDFNNLDKENITKMLFQNFIQNDGDYRVFVVGGRTLGAMKRIANEGSFLNNISQGGNGEIVSDPKVLKKITKIALKVASLFDLQVCGVDIIYDIENKKYFLMEVNQIPQWQGFKDTTQINIPMFIADFFIDLDKQGKEETRKIVKEYFDKNIDNLHSKKFHYFSRMYLWTKGEEYSALLEKFGNEYIGQTEEETKEKVQNRLQLGLMQSSNLEEKYKKLNSYKNILFFDSFANNVFGRDISHLLNEVIDKNELRIMYKDLLANGNDLAKLSVTGINFLYLVEKHINEEKIDPEKLLIAYALKPESESISKKVYFLTHCILGASNFYTKKIDTNQETYIRMLQICEDLISNNFFETKLDIKCEFLVCAKLLNYKSKLETLIHNEANNSLSSNGNFIINKFNKYQKEVSSMNNIQSAEHTNVLYLMSFETPYILK